MADWQISKPIGVCSGTSKEFQPGEEYFAALVETENGLERRDFTIDYWQNNRPQVFCYWKTRLPDTNEKKPVFIDDDMLMSFFERLENETDQEKINFRFVLTLILMRKRKLKYDSSKIEHDKEIWTLKVAGEKRTVQVENPHLNEDQIEQLSSQVGQILQVDLQEE